MLSRENAKLAAVAAVSITVALAAPAAATAAYDALNADKVDGKHAVAAGASVNNRKGKLVATSATTGRLPNNIVAKAPDADRLDGMDSSKLRYINLDVMAAFVNGVGSGQSRAYGPNFGIHLVDGGGDVSASVVVPPDFTGTSMKLHVLWHIAETGCSVQVLPNSVSVGGVGTVIPSGGSSTAGLSGGGVIAAPGTANQVAQTVWTLGPPSDSRPLQPGQAYGFGFFRNNGSDPDNCTADLVIGGMWITY